MLRFVFLDPRSRSAHYDWESVARLVLSAFRLESARAGAAAEVEPLVDELRRLSPEFAGERVLGLGFDRDVLLKAGIEGADAFAAVSSGDNSNIISARLARETFGVRRVVARIDDGRCGSRGSNDRHESVIPWRNITG